MRLAIAATETQREEWLEGYAAMAAQISWHLSAHDLANAEADAYIDLTFLCEQHRIKMLQQLLPKPVIINAVTETLKQSDEAFLRINGWPGFLKRKTCELAAAGTASRNSAKQIFEPYGISCVFVPDITGMVTPRIIACLVNEAYFTFEAGTATKKEIDLAMKLGTNYPVGPFDWATQIGLHRIASLLIAMEKENNMYKPCKLLLEEAGEIKEPTA